MAYKNERKAVRLFLLPDEYEKVRAAAFASGVSMAEFARLAAVEKAGEFKVEVVRPSRTRTRK
jgi:hypothetical protein